MINKDDLEKNRVLRSNADRVRIRSNADAYVKTLKTDPPPVKPKFPPSDVKKVELGNVLKEKDKDSVRVIKLDGKEFVLKPVNPENPDNVNHCLAADFIRRMGMPGVRAPQATLVRDELKDQIGDLLNNKLPSKEVPDPDGDLQLSEFSPGKDIEKIFEGYRKGEELNDEQDKLKKFALSEKGVAAFAGVAALDLLTGMRDRILIYWHGGNFAFDNTDPDEPTLSCHDNAKYQYGLSNPDTDEYKDFLKRVMTNANNGQFYPSVVEMIYDSVYGNRYVSASGNPGEFVGEISAEQQSKMKEIIRKTLFDACDKVAKNEKRDSEEARRAKVLNTMMKVEQSCLPPEWAINIKPPESDATASAAGMATGASRSVRAGAAAVSSKLGLGGSGSEALTNWIKNTEKLKSKLRNLEVNREDAISQLEGLAADYKDGEKDRRYTNIMFLANACGFIDFLEAGTDALTKGLSDELSHIPVDFRSEVLEKVNAVLKKIRAYLVGKDDARIESALRTNYKKFADAYGAKP